MYDLWIASCIAALAVGVFVWGLIFWCVIRYRKRGNELPVQTRYNLPMEFLYTIAPILIVSVLFYYTAVVQTDVNKDVEEPRRHRRGRRLQVELAVQLPRRPGPRRQHRRLGPRHQRGHPGAGAADRPGRSGSRSTSRDVIHSFWVPELLFKRDVFPGNIRNVFEVTSLDQEGAYVGRCAELCGSYHAFMNFELRVVSPEKYDQFLAAKKAGKSTQEALKAIGEPEYATTTQPFNTRRDKNNFNPSDASAGAGS